jgi:hypothetical protein
MAEFIVNHAWWAVPVYTALAILVSLGFIWRRKPLGWIWLFFLLMLPFLLNLILFIPLWLPFARLFEGLTQRPAHMWSPDIWIFLWNQ